MAQVPIQLLMEEFSDPNDLEARRRGASGLVVLSKVMGPARTCSELLPRVTDIIEASKEQDEVMFQFVKSLEKICDMVEKNWTAVLPPLEALMTVEETTVRDRAITITCEIIKRLSAGQAAGAVMPIMKRLASAEWFTPRRSACGLLGTLYTKLDAPHRIDIIEMLAVLVEDETPMVRRAVATALGEMALAPGGEATAKSTLLPDWVKVTEDAHVSVRYAGVCASSKLASALGPEDTAALMMPHFKKLSSYRGWRSRMAASSQLGGMARALSASAIVSLLLPCIATLVKDCEDDVCEPAISQLREVHAVLVSRGDSAKAKVAFADAVVPLLEGIVMVTGKEKPASPRVRRTVARTSLALAHAEPNPLGASFARLWEFLLSDMESKDASDIRRITIEGLENVVVALGDAFSLSQSSKWGKILRTLYESSKTAAVDEFNVKHANSNAMNNAGGAPGGMANGLGDALPGEPVETPKWRMRVAVLRNLSHLAKADKAYAIQVWTGALSDEAHEVRVVAGDALEALCAEDSGAGGVDGVVRNYVPVLTQFWRKAKEEGSYQHRITAVHAFVVLSTFPPAWSTVSAMMGEALADPVTNVCIAALRGMRTSPAARAQFKANVDQLKHSEDKDVAECAASLS